MSKFETCRFCGEPFKVGEHGLSMPGTKEREPVDCPTCKQTHAERVSNGWWNTYKLTPEERAEWEAEQKQ